MLEFSTAGGGRIFLNLSEQDRYDFDAPKIAKRTRDALKRITSLHWNKAVSEKELEAADVVYKDALCLSPVTVFYPLHKDICNRFNDNSEYGWELREALDAAGAFDFMERVSDPANCKGTIERILAVFTACTFGLTTIEETPLDYVHAVVGFFRSENGVGWSERLVLKHPAAIQCLGNVVKGLSKVFEDASLLTMARRRRTPSGEKVGWAAFERSKHPVDVELLEWRTAFAEESRMKPRNLQDACLALSAWIKADYPGRSLLDLLSQGDRHSSFSDFVKKRNDAGVTSHTRSLVNDARNFYLGILEYITPRLHEGAVYDLVSQRELNRIKDELLAKPKPSRSTARPLPEKLAMIAKEILDEGENGWAGTSGHFHVEPPGNPGGGRIYCPVIPTLLRAMLEVPLRMVQLRRLDSGEGDPLQYNPEAGAWEPNIGPLSGYWARMAGKEAEGFPSRGYACQIQDDIKVVTGINVNTNKTGEPYQIPWTNEVFLKLFWDLRKWQEKHNPISTPLSGAQYVDGGAARTPAATIARLPDIFPVARMFANDFWPWPGRIVTSAEIDHAWKFMLIELERRWNDRHPGNLVQLVEINPRTKQPVRPKYTLHGLRVMGLTNLSRGGMPLPMLSRFVAGHASLAMTIYYLNFHPTEIAESIEKALLRTDAQREFIDFLKRSEVDEVRRRTVSVDAAAVPEAFKAQSQFQFCNTELGICPFDGTRCSDGGALLRKNAKGDTETNVYGPVAPRNCVMCRHFISGPPWLNQLLAYGTKLCERRQHLQADMEDLKRKFLANDAAFKAGKVTREESENVYDTLQVDQFAIRTEQEETENAIFNVELLCNASAKLLDGDEGRHGVDLVTSSRSSFVEYRETTEFEQAARITAAGRIHKILGDERVEAKRNKYLNLILYNSGITPPDLLANITDEQRRRALDQFAKLVLEKASSEAIGRLADGDMKLRDLRLEQRVRKLLEVSLSDPVSLRSDADGSLPALEAMH